MAAALLLVTIGALATGAPTVTRAQTAAQCFDTTSTSEAAGPTDVSATSGNQNLSVAVNRAGTITVFKWPSPSFYDQIKYRTTRRDEPRLGAKPNEGAFIGVAWQRARNKTWRFEWLRQWTSTQRFASSRSDEVITRYTKPRLGLTVVVRDVVAARRDALLRHVRVTRARSSSVRRVRVVAFANYNPVFSKTPQAPVQDWCFEERNDDGASYDAAADAVVHARSGVDESTGRPSSVAVALAFLGRSDQHAVGGDTYEGGASGPSAYDDAADASLTGSGAASGQADAALVDELDLRLRRTRATVVALAADASAEDVVENVRALRGSSYSQERAAKERVLRAWLSTFPLPKDAPRSVMRLSRRALISLKQAIDANTPEVDPEGYDVPPGNLIVASLATQPPLGQDWIRHGAYVNHALDRGRRPLTVALHNLRYSILQMKTGDSTRGGEPIPPGNWHMNYYADGIVGGPIPYEIDETGYGLWTLWNHYELTGDRAYLLAEPIYEAIQRGAQYLTDVCRDPSTGLQCAAPTGDDPNPTQNLRGAMLAWLGLDAAIKAARVKGGEVALANAARWQARRDELGAAIREHFFDPDCRCYTRDHRDGGVLLWPVSFLKRGSRRAERQAEVNWQRVAPAFAGRRARGGGEALALLGNAHVWQGRPRKLRLLKRGLRWIAEVPTTDGTGILGGAWMRYPTRRSPVTTIAGQPHVWEQIVFYLAALKVYGAG